MSLGLGTSGLGPGYDLWGQVPGTQKPLMYVEGDKETSVLWRFLQQSPQPINQSLKGNPGAAR